MHSGLDSLEDKLVTGAGSRLQAKSEVSFRRNSANEGPASMRRWAKLVFINRLTCLAELVELGEAHFGETKLRCDPNGTVLWDRRSSNDHHVHWHHQQNFNLRTTCDLAGERDYAIFILVFETGMGAHEIPNPKRPNIDQDDPVSKIRLRVIGNG